jgi:hypothetical protein
MTAEPGDADGRVLIVWLLSETHHQRDRSGRKSVDPFDGGQGFVPVCATGTADMRVGSNVDWAVKRPRGHRKNTDLRLRNRQCGSAVGAKALYVA